MGGKVRGVSGHARDPTRRNRNIGRSWHGLGADNRFEIPQSWHSDRLFYERLVDPVVVRRRVSGRDLVFLVEPPRNDCLHPCSVDDVQRVLEHLPLRVTANIDAIVLRQPKRKEQLLSACWGRLVYWSELGRFSGVSVYLEAQERQSRFRLPRSQTPFGLEELRKLESEGHRVERTARYFEITSSAAACRRTQLYRTLPHEAGHLEHYLQALEAGLDHWSRPVLECEQFAEAFAAKFRESAVASGAIPFEPLLDSTRAGRERLDTGWFAA